MKYFYDTEFIEDGRSIRLLSIGVVCEDGREFYRIVKGGYSKWSDAANHQWLRENVLPSMPGSVDQYETVDGGDLVFSWNWLPAHQDFQFVRNNSEEVGRELYQFMLDGITRESNTDFELWADFAAYDHVALCQLFGPMSALPPGMPMWTHDFQQELSRWSPEWRAGLPEQPKDQRHNALADARHLALQYKWIQDALSHPF